MRPVFWQELTLLGLDKYWTYHECDEPLLFRSKKKYFDKEGNVYFSLKGGSIAEKPKLIWRDELFSKNYNPSPITKEWFEKKYRQHLDEITEEALDFIRITHKDYTNKNNADWHSMLRPGQAVVKLGCDSFDIMPIAVAKEQGKQIIPKCEFTNVSYSGGKDSQVLVDLCYKALPEKSYEVLFADTGYELPDNFSQWDLMKKKYGCEFNIVKNHKDVLWYWDRLGSPSRVQRWCCGIMKTSPIHIYFQNKYGDKKYLSFVGIRKSESVKRRNYQRIGVAKYEKNISAYPMFEWSEMDIWLYLIMNNISFNKAYRYGIGRVGCVICPFGSGYNDWIHYQLYKERMQPFLDRLEKQKDKNYEDVEGYIIRDRWKCRTRVPVNIPIDHYMEFNFDNSKKELAATLYNPMKNPLNTFLKIIPEKILDFSITASNKKTEFVFRNIDKKQSSLIKTALRKATYCINCGACHPVCPTSALKTIPEVSFDKTKCRHCYLCFTSLQYGCIVSWSLYYGNYKQHENKKKMQNDGNQ